MKNNDTDSPSKKGNPIPVRFLDDEDEFLKHARRTTGLSLSELVRKSVRLMRREASATQGFGFLLNLPQ